MPRGPKANWHFSDGRSRWLPHCWYGGASGMVRGKSGSYQASGRRDPRGPCERTQHNASKETSNL
jgi:hypothetical protein